MGQDIDKVVAGEANLKIGEDLYAVSIEQLNARLDLLRAEIVRIEAEIEKKAKDMSAAHKLFGS